MSIVIGAMRPGVRVRRARARHGWRNLPEEWWHFALKDEPFAERDFDVPVK